MKTAIFAAALCVGLAASGSAFAERWVQLVNGTVSAMMMTGGGVMMKIQLPAKEFQVLERDMKANNNSCIIKEIYTASADSMVLVCGAAGSTVQ